METRQRRIYAKRSLLLMLVVVALGAALGFGAPLLVGELLSVGWLQPGPGYFAIAIGVPVAMLVLVFWFCARQEDLDRKAGVADHY
ncbi:MAG: sodium/substrate symporter small subunit [Alphaproteobacteria bacterium]